MTLLLHLLVEFMPLCCILLQYPWWLTFVHLPVCIYNLNSLLHAFQHILQRLLSHLGKLLLYLLIAHACAVEELNSPPPPSPPPPSPRPLSPPPQSPSAASVPSTSLASAPAPGAYPKPTIAGSLDGPASANAINNDLTVWAPPPPSPAATGESHPISFLSPFASALLSSCCRGTLAFITMR